MSNNHLSLLPGFCSNLENFSQVSPADAEKTTEPVMKGRLISGWF